MAFPSYLSELVKPEDVSAFMLKLVAALTIMILGDYRQHNSKQAFQETIAQL